MEIKESLFAHNATRMCISFTAYMLFGQSWSF